MADQACATPLIGGLPPTGATMSHVTYRIVRHDDGWAYTVNGVFSEPFPTHAAALAAARARPPPSSACPGTQRGSNTRTRKGTGTPRRLPAAIVRTPTSRARIELQASRLGWAEPQGSAAHSRTIAATRYRQLAAMLCVEITSPTFMLTVADRSRSTG